jgi:hypothetical protein
MRICAAAAVLIVVVAIHLAQPNRETRGGCVEVVVTDSAERPRVESAIPAPSGGGRRALATVRVQGGDDNNGA